MNDFRSRDWRISGDEAMPRVKRGTKRRARRKKLLKHAKGFFLTKGKLFRSAKEAVNRSLRYSYRDRRTRKRDFRRLWIQRIGAAARNNGMTYSQLVHGLNAGRLSALERLARVEDSLSWCSGQLPDAGPGAASRLRAGRNSVSETIDRP